MTSSRITHKLTLKFNTEQIQDRKDAIQALMEATISAGFADINFTSVECGNELEAPCVIEFASPRFDALLSFESWALGKLQAVDGLVLH